MTYDKRAWFVLTCVVAIALRFLPSCVQSVSPSGNPGANDVVISPATVTLRIGQLKTFTADVQGSGDDSVQWTISGLAGSLITQGPNSARLVLGGNSGVFTLKATSLVDGTKSGTATVQIVDFNYGFSVPVPKPGTDLFQVAGDMAVGGSKAYLAYLTDGFTGISGNSVEQFDLAELSSFPIGGMNFPAPLFSVQTIFDASTNAPRITADGAGNGYWIHDHQEGVVARMDPSGVVRGVDFTLPIDVVDGTPSSNLSALGLTLATQSDIASDAAGTLYFIAADGGPGGFKLVRLTDAFGPQPTFTTLGSPLGASPPSYRLSVDSEGGVLMATSSTAQRLLPNGTLDTTFNPPNYQTAIRDIGADAGGLAYLTTSDPVSICNGVDDSAEHTNIHVLNALGLEIKTIDQLDADPNAEPCLQKLVGVGVAADGTLIVFDDVHMGTHPPPANSALNAYVVAIKPN